MVENRRASTFQFSLSSLAIALAGSALFFGGVVLANSCHNQALIHGYSNGFPFASLAGHLENVELPQKGFELVHFIYGGIIFLLVLLAFSSENSPASHPRENRHSQAFDLLIMIAVFSSAHLAVLFAANLDEKDNFFFVAGDYIHYEQVRYRAGELLCCISCFVLYILRKRRGSSVTLPAIGSAFFLLRLTYQARWPPAAVEIWTWLSRFSGVSYSSFRPFFLVLPVILLAPFFLYSMRDRHRKVAATYLLALLWCLVDVIWA